MSICLDADASASTRVFITALSCTTASASATTPLAPLTLHHQLPFGPPGPPEMVRGDDL